MQVPVDIPLAQLHLVLQAALGWENSHLHGFVIGRVRIGMPDPMGFENVVDERKVRLHEIARARSRFSYEYDFGDGWEHDILVEKALVAEPGMTYPRCIAGLRACLPEDCGGPWGYADLLAALADPDHENHEDKKEWLGGDFDPESFDLAATDARLRHRPRRGASSR